MIDSYQNVVKFIILEKECLYKVLERKIEPSDISEETLSMLLEVIINLSESKKDVHSSSINDEIEKSFPEDKKSIKSELMSLMNNKMILREEFDYHLNKIVSNKNKKILIQTAQYILQNVSKNTEQHILEEAIKALATLDIGSVSEKKFDDVLNVSFSQIYDVYSGKSRPFLKTGFPKLDNNLAITRPRLILIASNKKIGKTKFLIAMMDQIIRNNTNIAVQWYTLESPATEIVNQFLSRASNIDESILSGRKKNKKLDAMEIQLIEGAKALFSTHPIEFIDEPVDIFAIESKFHKFCKNNKGKHNILIIDNIGCISQHIENDTSFENDLARHFKNIRDKDNVTIFAIHHMNKDVDSKWNRAEAYKPKMNQVRGSSRLSDYANQVLLLHRPSAYKDLLAEAKRKMDAKEYALYENLFTVDIAVNRHDGVSPEESEIDFSCDLGTCNFKEL
jgi:replicative DNA helicase